ncbi:hypothetical protein [Clostridium intestinale]|uniref:Uncharacterized protein n=1 Tax=Clostridium intestinale DSM 6191 TaxID=1121320 RepID=A0A1M5ZV42_9CLOT|nr:hypothetical protein [Clostridium intestinale]SHI28110.1 hypothetical protein SAMN02745941_03444 [Clostridium intestinale DSM 6191]
MIFDFFIEIIISAVVTIFIIFNCKKIRFITIHRIIAWILVILLFLVNVGLNVLYKENRQIILLVVYSIVQPIIYILFIYLILSLKKKNGR